MQQAELSKHILDVKLGLILVNSEQVAKIVRVLKECHKIRNDGDRLFNVC